jgi:hypothetical protein
MRERAIRVIAGLIALIAGAWAVGALFRHQHPADRTMFVIAFRFLFFGGFAVAFLFRALGAKFIAAQWLVYAVACVVWISDGRIGLGRLGTATFAISAVLASAGAVLEWWQRRAAQHRVAADRAAPGR